MQATQPMPTQPKSTEPASTLPIQNSAAAPMINDTPPLTSQSPSELNAMPKLTWWQYALSCLPITLIVSGGLVGGAVGGFLIIPCMNIWKKDWNTISKIGYIIGITAGGFLLIIVLATIVQLIFNPE